MNEQSIRAASPKDRSRTGSSKSRRRTARAPAARALSRRDRRPAPPPRSTSRSGDGFSAVKIVPAGAVTVSGRNQPSLDGSCGADQRLDDGLHRGSQRASAAIDRCITRRARAGEIDFDFAAADADRDLDRDPRLGLAVAVDHVASRIVAVRQRRDDCAGAGFARRNESKRMSPRALRRRTLPTVSCIRARRYAPPQARH